MANKSYEDAIAALRKAAASDDEEVAKKARRMLKAELAEDDAPADKKDEPDGDEGKAEAPPPPAPEKKDEDAKAGAVALAEVRALRAEQKLAAEATERAQLLASRPDFSPEMRAGLAGADIATVRSLVATLPKSALPKPAAAAAATGTRGEGQGDGNVSRLPAAEKHTMDKVMGLVAHEPAIENSTYKLTLGAHASAKTK